MRFLLSRAIALAISSSLFLFAQLSHALPVPTQVLSVSPVVSHLEGRHNVPAISALLAPVEATVNATDASLKPHHHHTPQHTHHHAHFHKRHDYTLMCFSPSDRTDPKSPKIDDVPLARRCTSRPYRYSCDANANPDILDGGKTDKECDRYCECRNTGANPKPYCVGILGWNSYSTCF
ncbi:uncharacterized protein AB675_2834 [Cyphellophora attinorum]|uniref:Uncharacterized protein n=1 Tax=Cyphellophora attinorum TaxID=1664694 RepID=A0A0N1I0S0_9EURO|nr:uncharacterized protein AB675_2834 [Phialophora attinorum]KPI45203.1 hypothetical protein AB675_2834 [Phialophora attinorum]